MNCLNLEDFGEPLAIIQKDNTTKSLRNSKNHIYNDPVSCQFCYKKIAKGTKARHHKICTVKKAGGSVKILSVSSDKKAKIKKSLTSFDCAPNEHLQIIPNRDKERSVWYISGQSGSGKSYYMNKLIQEYHSMFPKKSIYLFSLLKTDPSITLKSIKRIELNEKFVQTDLTLDDFEDSLIIYDDVDTISQSAIKAKLMRILDQILQCGRHKRISMVYISHLPCNGKDTRLILSEANFLTIFPRSMGSRAIRYLLSEYFGLSKQQVSKIKKLDSRFITLCRTFPMVILYDTGAYLLSSEDN